MEVLFSSNSTTRNYNTVLVSTKLHMYIFLSHSARQTEVQKITESGKGGKRDCNRIYSNGIDNLLRTTRSPRRRESKTK